MVLEYEGGTAGRLGEGTGHEEHGKRSRKDSHKKKDKKDKKDKKVFFTYVFSSYLITVSRFY